MGKKKQLLAIGLVLTGISFLVDDFAIASIFTHFLRGFMAGFGLAMILAGSITKKPNPKVSKALPLLMPAIGLVLVASNLIIIGCMPASNIIDFVKYFLLGLGWVIIIASLYIIKRSPVS